MASKFVIFDLDGTLIDSFECVLRCVNKTLDTFSLPQVVVNPSEVSGDIELIFGEAKRIINGHISFREFKARFDSVHFVDCEEAVGCIVRTSRLMLNFNKDKRRIVILTNKREDIARKIVGYFYPTLNPLIIGRKEAGSIKNTDSAPRELAACGLSLKDCLHYYGDSIQDAALAEAFDIPFTRVVTPQTLSRKQF